MKTTLLIVDDIKAIREKLRDCLENDFEVVGLAGSGQEAIEICREKTPRLVLMDLVMPKMSGIDATKQILASVNPPPQIVVLSALHDETILLRAMEAGVSEYLLKPVSDSKIKQVLRDLVREAA